MWYNLYDNPYSTFPDEDGNANLFETVGYLIVAKPETNSTWDLFHLVPDFGRQTFQHSRPQFGSNDTSAGTSVQDGKPFLGNPTQVRSAVIAFNGRWHRWFPGVQSWAKEFLDFRD